MQIMVSAEERMTCILLTVHVTQYIMFFLMQREYSSLYNICLQEIL